MNPFRNRTTDQSEVFHHYNFATILLFLKTIKEIVKSELKMFTNQ